MYNVYVLEHLILNAVFSTTVYECHVLNGSQTGGNCDREG